MSKEKLLAIDDLALYHALLELNLIEEEKLDQLIQLQQKYSDKKLGEFLLDQKGIKDEWVERIVEYTSSTARLEGMGSGSGGELPLVEDPSRLVGRNIGKYEIIRLIARGGMGFVYEGFDSTLERRVAIKLLAPALSKNMEYRQRFIREAKLLAKIEHPNVVGVYDFGEAEDTLFLATQYVEGKTLEEIAQHQKLQWEETFRYLRDVIAGLSEAHKIGIVHRDIKPANILVDSSGRGILTDFGIAYVDQSDLTQSGKSLGTPLYMAPEILEGKAVDLRGDIYSLGVSAYFLLSGENPFASDTPYEIIHRQLQGEYLPLEQLVDLPQEIYQFINLLMKRNPDERPQNLEQVSVALEQAEKKALQKEGIPSLLRRKGLSWVKKIWRVIPKEFLPKGARKNLKYYLGGGAVVVLLIGLALFLPGGKKGSTTPLSGTTQTKKDKNFKELMEKVDQLADQGKIEGAIEILEESRRAFPAERQKDLDEKCQQMENSRRKWILLFQEADKKGRESLKKGRTSLARRIYRTFQNLDIPGIQANLNSRLMAIRKIDKKKIDQLTREALNLLKEEKLREAMYLYDSCLADLPTSMKKSWERSYRAFFNQVMEKVDKVLFQRDYSVILEWYNLLQNIPLKDLAEKASLYFEKFKDRLKKDLETFVMRYQLSAQEEEKGNFQEAIDLIEKYSSQPSPFQKIAQERMRSLKKILAELPEGTRRVYGIYESYMGKFLLLGNKSYYIPVKDREKFLTSFDVGDPLCLLIRDKNAIEIQKNPIALHLEKAKNFPPRILISCSLKNREILGLYYGHSPSELLIGEHQGSLFPKIERIPWSQVTKIQKN